MGLDGFVLGRQIAVAHICARFVIGAVQHLQGCESGLKKNCLKRLNGLRILKLRTLIVVMQISEFIKIGIYVLQKKQLRLQ
jgi:hypothetical protein